MSLEGVCPPSCLCQHCAASQSDTVHMWSLLQTRQVEPGGVTQIYMLHVCVCVWGGACSYVSISVRTNMSVLTFKWRHL